MILKTLLVISVLMSYPLWAGLSMKEAEELIKHQDDFPLVVNEVVLEQLNLNLNSRARRAYFKESLRRKKKFDSLLERNSQRYLAPDELNAIPIIESGYVNTIAKGRLHAAGLWMFIPATARRYGMKVNKQQDERLNVEKETDGAYRYLMNQKRIFKDWHLALLAYNVGEGRVQRGIKKYKTRDAWELISKGVEGDKGYLPNIMAAMIIMKNPHLLDN